MTTEFLGTEPPVIVAVLFILLLVQELTECMLLFGTAPQNNDHVVELRVIVDTPEVSRVTNRLWYMPGKSGPLRVVDRLCDPCARERVDLYLSCNGQSHDR